MENANLTNLLEKGNQEMRDGQLPQAIETFTSSIGLDPENPAPYLSRGMASMQNNDFDSAIKDFTRVIQLNPKRVAAWYHLGICHLQKIDFNSAIVSFTRVTQLAPTEAAGWYYRGICYAENDDLRSAFQDFSKAIGLDETEANAWYERGRCCLGKGDYASAIRDLEKAISLAPDHSSAHLQLALHYLQKGGKPQRALEMAIKAVQLDPTDVDAQECLGDCSLKMNDLDLAMTAFNKVIELGPADVAIRTGFLGLGKCHMEKGEQNKDELDKAIEVLSTVIETLTRETLPVDADLQEAYDLRRQCYAKQGKMDLSAQDFAKFIELDEVQTFVSALRNLATAFKEVKDSSKGDHYQKLSAYWLEVAEKYGNQFRKLAQDQDKEYARKLYGTLEQAKTKVKYPAVHEAAAKALAVLRMIIQG